MTPLTPIMRLYILLAILAAIGYFVLPIRLHGIPTCDPETQLFGGCVSK